MIEHHSEEGKLRALLFESTFCFYEDALFKNAYYVAPPAYDWLVSQGFGKDMQSPRKLVTLSKHKVTVRLVDPQVYSTFVRAVKELQYFLDLTKLTSEKHDAFYELVWSLVENKHDPK